MKKDQGYYDGLPWRVIIDPEQQEDGRIIFWLPIRTLDS